MTTAHEIFIEVGPCGIGRFESHEGAYVVRPPVDVRDLKTGGVFPVEAIDFQIGHSAAGGLVLIKGQEGWRPAGQFELFKRLTWVCPKNNCPGKTRGSTCHGFCSECGAPLEQVLSEGRPANIHCLCCKARCVFLSDKFCRACGYSLKGGQ